MPWVEELDESRDRRMGFDSSQKNFGVFSCGGVTLILTPSSTYSLPLADGTCWLVRAGVPEAEHVVARLGAAMELPPGGGSGRELVVGFHGHQASSPAALRAAQGPSVCLVSPPCNGERFAFQAMQISMTIVRDAQVRGGLLIHGALAAWQGSAEKAGGMVSGAIMAGPGSVGKTTASSRLSGPWRSLSDDMTLVVRDPQGHYWAHPWPTWGRFLENAAGVSWPVPQGRAPAGRFFPFPIAQRLGNPTQHRPNNRPADRIRAAGLLAHGLRVAGDRGCGCL